MSLDQYSLYGLLAKLEQEEKDFDEKELKTELQTRLLTQDDLEFTAVEKKLVSQYVQKLLAQAKAEGNGKKEEKLQELLAKVSKTSTLKEPRAIRKLIFESKKVETEHEKAAETLQKWRDGKHKLKNVAEADALQRKERDLGKEVRQLGEKLEKLRQTRQNFGATDSDDDFDRARPTTWTSVKHVVPNPAAKNPATSKSKSASANKATIANRGGGNQWRSNEMTLAQQLQMRMVADLKAQEQPASRAEEDGDTTAGGKTVATAAQSQVSQQATTDKEQDWDEGEEDDFWEEMQREEEVWKQVPSKDHTCGRKATGVGAVLQAGKKDSQSDDDSDTVDVHDDAQQAPESKTTSTAKKSRSKNKKGSSDQRADEAELARLLREQAKAKTKSTAKKGPSFFYTAYQAARKEFCENSILYLLLQNSPVIDADAMRTAVGVRNPLGLGPQKATTTDAYIQFFTGWKFSFPIGLANASTKSQARKAAEKGAILVDPEFGSRMKENVGRWYPVVANLTLLATLFWHRGTWWAMCAFALLGAQTLLLEVPEAASAICVVEKAGKEQRELILLKSLHVGLWLVFMAGAIAVFAWSFLLFVSIVTCALFASLQYAA
ncbi:unnamed protein product [Amoebophrya sp. A120]|nr:unnamed protein product [Amoebophrya sp. A120]|eukprot:GSA120T00011862001.1